MGSKLLKPDNGLFNALVAPIDCVKKKKPYLCTRLIIMSIALC